MKYISMPDRLAVQKTRRWRDGERTHIGSMALPGAANEGEFAWAA